MVDLPAMFDYLHPVHPKNPSKNPQHLDAFCVNCEDPFRFLERISIALDISLVPFFGLGGWPLGPTNRVWNLRFPSFIGMLYTIDGIEKLVVRVFYCYVIFCLRRYTAWVKTRYFWDDPGSLLINQDFTEGRRSWNPSQIEVSKLKSKLDQLVDMKEEGAKN